MVRFQKSFNAFIEQFQDRWETQPAFRATWGTLGAGSFLLILCVAALVGSNLLGSLFAGAGNVTKGSLVVAGNGNSSNFPLNKLTPQGTDASGTKPTVVATSTFGTTPTPTVTPANTTPTPDASGTPSATTFTASAMMIGTWKAGTPGKIDQFATAANPVPSQMLTVTLQFGDPAQNCMATITVQLDQNGAYPGQKTFGVPTCFSEATAQVSALYHIDGFTDFPFPNEFTAQK